MTADNRTNEQIVAEAMVDAGAPLMHSRVEEAVVTALRDAGRLAGGQLPGNTGQFTEAQVEAAAKALREMRNFDEGVSSLLLESWSRMVATTALEAAARAAQDAAPQAGFDEWLNEIRAEAWEEGFDAGEADVFMHEEEGYDSECLKNPYRPNEK